MSTGPLKEIGVLFDINELGSAFYGLVAWKIFLKNCDPQRLSSGVLLHGDTRETLQGGARHFCIAVRAPDPRIIAYVKEIFTNSEDRGLSPLNQRFIEGCVTSVTGGYQPLPIWGRVDAHGRFVTEKYNPYYEQVCEYAGWTYAPLNLSQLVHDSFIFGKDQKIFAAKKVAQYGDLQALAVLKKHLETEKDEDVRRVCEEALDKITPQQVPATLPIVPARPTPEEVKPREPPPKKYCIYCGSEMPLEGKHCPRCGKRQVEVQAAKMKSRCTKCGQKMTITSKGVFYFGSGEPNIVKLRCEQCDLTRFERKPDIERELGRTLPGEFTLTPQQY